MAPKPPSPPVGTLPVAVSPRGGPQPARKSAAARAASSMVQTALKPKAQPAPLTLAPSIEDVLGLATPVAPGFGDTVISSTPAPTVGPGSDQSWKPDFDLLRKFLVADASSGGSYVPLGGVRGQASNKGWSSALDQPGTDGIVANTALATALATSQTPEDLAKNLGMDLNELGPLLERSAAQKAAVDSAVAGNNAAADKAGAQAKARLTPPQQGGMTPDSIDRAPDPFSLVTPQQMSSTELDALIQSMDYGAADQEATRLEAAKRAIMADTAVAIDRQNQLMEAYRAGMQGGEIRTAPAPGESTAQGRYKTAGRQTAQAAMPPLELLDGSLDPKAVEDKILQAGQVIERTRAEEKRQQVISMLTEQRDAQARAEKELAAEQDKAAKEQEKAARKQADLNFEQETRRLYARALKDEFSSRSVKIKTEPNSSSVSAVSGDVAYEKVRSLASVGARRTDILTQVFGVDPNLNPEDITPDMLAIIQAAEFSVGGNPTGLKADWEKFAADRRAAVGMN